MKQYIIGFVLWLSTVSVVSFAIDYSDIDFSGARYDFEFKYEVKKNYRKL